MPAALSAWFFCWRSWNASRLRFHGSSALLGDVECKKTDDQHENISETRRNSSSSAQWSVSCFHLPTPGSETRRDRVFGFIHVTLCSRYTFLALCGQLATQTDLKSIHGSAEWDMRDTMEWNCMLMSADGCVELHFPLVINNDKKRARYCSSSLFFPSPGWPFCRRFRGPFLFFFVHSSLNPNLVFAS